MKKLDAEIAAIAAKKPFQDFVPVLDEVAGQVPQTFLFHRGDHQQPKGEIAPGGLTVASPPGERLAIAPKDPARPTSGRRLALARWLTSDGNPLTARVLVNRVWLQPLRPRAGEHAGRFRLAGRKALAPGIARLAGPRLHGRRLEAEAAAQDDHDLDASIAKAPPAIREPPSSIRKTGCMADVACERLDAETLRDRILATSGVLSDKMFGPAVPVKEDAVGQVVDRRRSAGGRRAAAGHEAFRRSIYIQVRRSQPLAMLHAFDQPVMETNCERRTVSTVATQS